MTINETRGEFAIELEGETYGMRPSFEAIDAFERGTGLSKQEAASRAGSGTLQMWQVAIIVTECVRAWGRATQHPAAPKFQVERVKELLAEENMLLVNKRLELMLFLSVTGGMTASGEAKPTSTRTETTTSEMMASAI